MNVRAYIPRRLRRRLPLAVLTLIILTPACAPQRSTPTTALCVPPPVTPCRIPIRPEHLETQADLLTAYIDALAAWAECRAEIEKIRSYYDEL